MLKSNILTHGHFEKSTLEDKQKANMLIENSLIEKVFDCRVANQTTSSAKYRTISDIQGRAPGLRKCCRNRYPKQSDFLDVRSASYASNASNDNQS